MFETSFTGLDARPTRYGMAPAMPRPSNEYIEASAVLFVQHHGDNSLAEAKMRADRLGKERAGAQAEAGLDNGRGAGPDPKFCPIRPAPPYDPGLNNDELIRFVLPPGTPSPANDD